MDQVLNIPILSWDTILHVQFIVAVHHGPPPDIVAQVRHQILCRLLLCTFVIPYIDGSGTPVKSQSR